MMTKQLSQSVKMEVVKWTKSHAVLIKRWQKHVKTETASLISLAVKILVSHVTERKAVKMVNVT